LLDGLQLVVVNKEGREYIGRNSLSASLPGLESYFQVVVGLPDWLSMRARLVRQITREQLNRFAHSATVIKIDNAYIERYEIEGLRYKNTWH
jgi:hypothetical protein